MHVQQLPLVAQTLLLGALCSTARAFSFSTNDPAECGDLTLTWSGGQAPFGLMIIPEFSPQITQTISDDSFQNGKGSFTMSLPLTSGQKFVVMMSDKTGPAAGGISNLLQVGASTGGYSCRTSPNPNKFSFDLPLALKQCGNYEFTGFTESGATPPVQVVVAVPGGTAEFLTIPKGQKTYDWIANLAAGTSVLFSMSDSTGGLGGSSDLLPVGDSDTKNCLDSSSPSSTAQPSPSSTSPTGSSTSAGGGSTTTESSHSISGRVVAAIIATSLVVCTAVIGGAVFFVWRRRHHSSSMKAEMIDLADDPAAATSLLYHPMYQPDPFTSAPNSANLPLTPPPPSGSEYDRSERESFTGSSDLGAAGPLPVKGAPNPHRPTTYVQHTDVYDLPVGDDGVVELPPQYSESRAPISGIPNLMDTPGAGSSGSSQHPPSPGHS